MSINIIVSVILLSLLLNSVSSFRALDEYRNIFLSPRKGEAAVDMREAVVDMREAVVDMREVVDMEKMVELLEVFDMDIVMSLQYLVQTLTVQEIV